MSLLFVTAERRARPPSGLSHRLGATVLLALASMGCRRLEDADGTTHPQIIGVLYRLIMPPSPPEVPGSGSLAGRDYRAGWERDRPGVR